MGRRGWPLLMHRQLRFTLVPPAKAAALATARSESAIALAKAEEDWLAAGAALEATAN